MTFNVEEVGWSTHEAPLMALRRRIFIEEQGVSEALELDGLDDLNSTQHFLGYIEDSPIAAGRLLASGQIGRICVSEKYRGKGYGTQLLKAIIRSALNTEDLPYPWLHAQTSALQLYRQCHFIEVGNIFIEADIPHQKMELKAATKDILEDVYDHTVVRLNSTASFLHHIKRVLSVGRKEVHILSQNLNSEIYHHKISELISRIARKHRQSNIKILVQDTTSLASKNHPLVLLARRLPSSITIHQLQEAPTTIEEAYVIVDRQLLVYFNHEAKSEGFVTYRGKAEAKNILASFENLWQHHSQRDPNLAQLSI